MLAVKGNREERIEEHEKDSYLSLGYDIYSDDLELEESSNSTDSKVEELENEIAELKKENSNLKGQITKLKNKLGESTEQ